MAHRCEIISARRSADRVTTFGLRKPRGYAFTPGQATDVAVDREGWRDEERPFTFTGLPDWDHLHFTIKSYFDHDGVTREIADLGPGDGFLIGEPWGTIAYKGAGTFIAGGAGITPFLAILHQIEDDARLLDHFVDRILGLKAFHLFTHDRGVSVGLAFLGHYLDRPANNYRITYHFMSNSGMFLPLATLSDQQTVLLHPQRGPEAIARLKALPRQTDGDPVQVAYADIHAFNDGIGARLHVGKYLLERAANETRWLDNLHRSAIPVGYLWGLLDPVNPVRIANHVWATYLNDRDVESSFWYLPTAGHYPQRDKPDAVAQVIRTCLTGQVPAREDEDRYMQQHTVRRGSVDDPVFVGHSVVRPMTFPGAVEYRPEGYR